MAAYVRPRRSHLRGLWVAGKFEGASEQYHGGPPEWVRIRDLLRGVYRPRGDNSGDGTPPPGWDADEAAFAHRMMNEMASMINRHDEEDRTDHREDGVKALLVSKLFSRRRALSRRRSRVTAPRGTGARGDGARSSVRRVRTDAPGVAVGSLPR